MVLLLHFLGLKRLKESLYHSGEKDAAELVVLVQVVLPPLLQVVMATLLAAYLGIERIAEHASRPVESSCPLRKAMCLATNSFKLLFTSSHEKLKRV